MNSPFAECRKCRKEILEHLNKCPNCGKVNPFTRDKKTISIRG